ncbi:MAG: hypothetical protein NVS2B12_20390 [Ktedonobacteraceae bacterium]
MHAFVSLQTHYSLVGWFSIAASSMLIYTYVIPVENVYETKQIHTTIVRETARIVNALTPARRGISRLCMITGKNRLAVTWKQLFQVAPYL